MDPRIQQVIRLLTSDLKRVRALNELGLSVNLSASRLSHLFKDETDTTPFQYLKNQRLQKARELLETTFLNLKEVMNETGFKDRSHFARDFKKMFGLPPVQYRNQYWRESEARKSLRQVAGIAIK